ncbi:HNH endonuclease [Levilactobacillus brevis]|uniref:HNH endonuclease signature motif containing protein n=1 Tax=Levilactobacillus brevis TaxID=1580 RepID=UPI0006938A31|nr:HNH endonuclease signature motif containing protein [Levilactobacillus brevis]RDF14229.1 HNH endonuclease [Levilactobacillus brevis]
MTKTAHSYTQKTLKNLLLLSGGSCEMCRNQIIFVSDSNDQNDKQKYNICEIAHICGLNKNSARYDTSKEKESLNNADNLMVLCPSCHKKIDKPENKELYTVSKLMGLKKTFEDESIEQMIHVINKTDIGGFTPYKNGKKLVSFLEIPAEEINDLNDIKDDSICEYKELKNTILSLKDLNLTSRESLLRISEACLKDNEYELSFKYWDSAYDLTKVDILETLDSTNFIDISEFPDDSWDNPTYMQVSEDWCALLDFLKTYEIPLEQLIMQRDFSIFD